LFAAIIIAEALSPLVDRMATKLPRSVAVVIPYLVFLGVIIGASWLVYPTLVSEAEKLVDRGPEVVAQAQAWLDDIDPTGNGRIQDLVTSRMQSASGALASIPFTIVSSVADVILVIGMSLYWLIAKPAARDFALSLVPEPHQQRADDVFRSIGSTIGGYIRATLLDSLIIGVLTYIGLLIIGVDYPLVLAVVAGIGEAIPVVGPLISAVPAVAVAALASPQQALIVVAFYIVLQQFENHALQPNIMRSQTDIPPLLVLFGLFAGGTAYGLLGALIAIPLTGAIKVIVVQVIAPAARKWETNGNASAPRSPEEE